MEDTPQGTIVFGISKNEMNILYPKCIADRCCEKYLTCPSRCCLIGNTADKGTTFWCTKKKSAAAGRC